MAVSSRAVSTLILVAALAALGLMFEYVLGPGATVERGPERGGSFEPAATAESLIDTPHTQDARRSLRETFRQLTRTATWVAVDEVDVAFDSHHPQGLAKDGEHLFLSSVEVLEPTTPYDTPRGGLDRSAGRGRGYLFKLNLDGELLAHVEIGEGTVYHPGGIDFDGTYIWVPVAEYRPDSRSIVYRVDPVTMEATEVFRFDDHLGAIVHNTDDGTLHGLSWGSRRYYTWRLDSALKVLNPGVPPAELAVPNPSYYVDYQDCQYVGAGEALCAGLNQYPGDEGSVLALGGLELVSLRTAGPLHQVPVVLRTETGRPMTQNPVEMEARADVLRAYFIPEDNRSRLFVYDVRIHYSSQPSR